ncbi:MAG: hypothetical protein GC151_11250 [Betaproteobacteria bacterium]|nr:hypothetical protein [Betaproteobacteria bacterium]
MEIWSCFVGAVRRAVPGICVPVLIGCAAGGGGVPAANPGPGGSPASLAGVVQDPSEPAPIAELFADPREAASGSVTIADVAAGVFALFPAFFEGEQLGTRSDDGAGGLAVTYFTTGGARRVVFAGTEIDRTGDGILYAERGAVSYLEAWADESGFRAEFSRLYALFHPDGASGAAEIGYFGLATPPAAIPATGQADYGGSASGLVLRDAGTAWLDGTVRMRADFSEGAVSGRIENLLAADLATGAETPLGADILFTASRTTGGPGLPAFVGVPTAERSGTGEVLTGPSSVELRAFGPAGTEIAGTWDLSWDDAGGTVQTYGAFLTRQSDTPLFADGVEPALPRLAGDITTSFEGGADADVLLPVYLTPFRTGYATRTRASDGSLTVIVRRNDGALRTEHFAASDLLVQSDGTTTASASGVVWRETGALEVTGDSLSYARFGELSYEDTIAGTLRSPVHFGFLTPDARVDARTGFAEYVGASIGHYRDATTDDVLAGTVLLRVDFDSARLEGRIGALEVRSASGGTRPLDQVLYVSGATTSATDAHVVGASLYGAGCCATATGALSAHFFGPGLEEMAGTWSAASVDYTLDGAFGARIATAEHPAGEIRLPPFASSVAESFGLRQDAAVVGLSGTGGVTSVTAVAADGFLRPEADGGLTLGIVRSGAAAEVTFARDELQSLYLGLEPYADTDFRLTAEKQQTSVFVAGEGVLSYTRFGYWEDGGTLPSSATFGAFHTGRETPSAEIPSTGEARYEGWTVGVRVSAEGLARVEGEVVLNANFAARTVTGEAVLSNGVWLTGNSSGNATPAFEIGHLEFAATIDPAVNHFSGAAQARPGATDPVSASGTVDGRFFGPAATEAGGTWNVATPDGTVTARGAFGVAR